MTDKSITKAFSAPIALSDLMDVCGIDADGLWVAVNRLGGAKAWVANQMVEARLAGVPTETWDVAAIIREVEAAIG